MLRSSAPQVNVSGGAALILFPLMAIFGGTLTALYLYVVIFILNLLGASVPVH